MNKTLVVSMNNINIQGDILDISCDNYGIIYNLSKDVLDEISLDYVDENNKKILYDRKYDACTFFFNLSKIFSKRKRDKMIKEVSKYIKKDGYIYLWDINKEIRKRVNNKIEIILPNGNVKTGMLQNNNPFIKCDFDEIIDSVQKYYVIEEKKVWEDMFFIKGRKID